MVKKLLKHEFIYYFRTFGMFLPIILAIGLMARVFRFFDDGNIINSIAIASSSLMLIVSCGALILLSTVVSVVRFYKYMYAADGYLTFTLPVTNAEHVFVKLLVAIVCQAVCLLTVVVAGVIALSGELLTDIFNLIGVAFAGFFDVFGTVGAVGFIAEVIILFLLMMW